MVTHTGNVSSAFNPFKLVLTGVVNTPEQWAAIFAVEHPGSDWGLCALLKGISVVSRQYWKSNPQPSSYQSDSNH